MTNHSLVGPRSDRTLSESFSSFCPLSLLSCAFPVLIQLIVLGFVRMITYCRSLFFSLRHTVEPSQLLLDTLRLNGLLRRRRRRRPRLSDSLRFLFREKPHPSPSPLTIHCRLLNIQSIHSKETVVFDLLSSGDCDVFGLSETWLRPGYVDDSSRALATPSGFTFFDEPRTDRRGGGVGLFCRTSSNPSRCNFLASYSSFEHLSVGVCGDVLWFLLYRPPSSDIGLFLDQFSDALSILSCRFNNLVVFGDFNLPKSCARLKELISIADAFGLRQLSSRPTHKLGGALDLVFSNLHSSLNSIDDSFSQLSDHFIVNFAISAPPAPSTSSLTSCFVRKLREVDREALAGDVSRFSFPSLGGVDVMLASFYEHLASCLDAHAPLVRVRTRHRLRPSWYTPALREAKRLRRSSERCLRAGRARGGDVSHLILHLRRATARYFSLLSKEREASSVSLVRSSRDLFSLVKNLSVPPPVSSSTITASELSSFFIAKVSRIRCSIPSTTSPLQDSFSALDLAAFSVPSMAAIASLIASSKKTSSPNDVFPPNLASACSDSLAKFLHRIFSVSVESGTFPALFKIGVVRPILKKPSLDPNCLDSYRPITILPFFSKILEKIVSSQISSHLLAAGVDHPLQSGFKAGCSSETALLRVSHDLRMAADAGKVSLLVLLDLSAAFDTVDHSTLLGRLRDLVGLSGSALAWCGSYLSDRTQSVYFNGDISQSSSVSCGVPQGSILGPLFFRIYTLPLAILLESLGFCFHFYADDTQIYLSFPPSLSVNAAESIEAGYDVISDWLSANYLKLNDNKTEIMAVGSSVGVSRLKTAVPSLTLGSSTVGFSQAVRNLGVLFDEQLRFDQHAAAIRRRSSAVLGCLSRIRNHFSSANFEILIHAFISSHLDFSNSLLLGAPRYVVDALQRVQNYAARVLNRSRKFSHVTPLLHSLHWLPVSARINFKALTLVYKSVHNLAPSYLSSLFSCYVPARPLRSGGDSSAFRLIVRRTRTSTFGDRAFGVAAALLWNKLPPEIRMSPNLSSFKKKLKTHLFLEFYQSCDSSCS